VLVKRIGGRRSSGNADTACHTNRSSVRWGSEASKVLVIVRQIRRSQGLSGGTYACIDAGSARPRAADLFGSAKSHGERMLVRSDHCDAPHVNFTNVKPTLHTSADAADGC
jgi:hypothetical protein